MAQWENRAVLIGWAATDFISAMFFQFLQKLYVNIQV